MDLVWCVDAGHRPFLHLGGKPLVIAVYSALFRYLHHEIRAVVVVEKIEKQNRS